MHPHKIPLASDNWSPAHPSIIQAMIEANEGPTSAYGSDPWTQEAEKWMQKIFKKECKTYMVPTGTGSNVLALKLSCRPHESVICTNIAHLHHQESGAAEAVVGCKLLTVPHKNGKITSEDLIKKLHHERAFGKHSTSPRLLSITQPTEAGTVYTLKELKALSQVCKGEHLLLHIDGSRLFNAAVSLNVPLDEMIGAADPDLLSLGGTKNGLIGAESLLVFNPSLLEGSDYLQKQTLQLPSKMRYLSAQYIALFKNDLWKTLAEHANQKGQEIASILKTIPTLSLSYPVETNQIFFTAPASWLPLLQEKIFCYPWDAEKNEIRFIASWNTTEEEVKSLRSTLLEISHILNEEN